MKTNTTTNDMKFKVINNELFAVRNAGYKLDGEITIDKSVKPDWSENRWDNVIDSFFDLDGAALCAGEDGEMYAVYFDGGSGRPLIWHRAVKATEASALKVNYSGGESIHGSYAVDFMSVVDGVPELDDDNVSYEDYHLYEEVKIEDSDMQGYGTEGFDINDCTEGESPEAEDRHYYQLKAAVIARAKALGIDINRLKFPWD